MASDTVPAATPGPGNPPGTTPDTATPSGFAGLLAPVAPARSEAHTFDLNPAHADQDATQADLSSASSADFGDDPSTGKADGQNTKETRRQQGVVRAWLLAGAERWRKGADTRNKALDVQKAKAQAYKEARTVSVNRAEKIVGGNTGTNTQSKADKSTGPGAKTNSGGQKNSSNTGRGGASGNSGGSGGRGTGGGSGSGNSGKKPSSGKDSASSSRTPSTHTGGKDTSSQGPKKSAKDSHASPSGSGKQHKTPTQTCGTDSGISLTKDKKPKTTKGDTGTSTATGPQQPGGHTGKNTPGGKTPTPATDNKPAGHKKNPDTKGGTKNVPATKKAPDTPAAKGDKTTLTPKTSRTGNDDRNGKGRWKGPDLNLQPSRETGYRDGTRLGKVEAHIDAYRHGVRDGRTDIKQAAAREKARLDQARSDHKPRPHTPSPAPTTVIPPKPAHPPTQPSEPAKTPNPSTQKKDQAVTPPPGATAPHTAQEAGGQVTPIPVTRIDAETLYLGAGAARPTISRKEVRTLRNFQAILEDKCAIATRVADQSRLLEQHALEQAKKVIQLVEQANAVHGGDLLLAKLSRAEEAANAQAAQAADIHRKAARAAERCKVVAANIEARYGEMYKAVINSPDTAPAEVSYYREMSHA